MNAALDTQLETSVIVNLLTQWGIWSRNGGAGLGYKPMHYEPTFKIEANITDDDVSNFDKHMGRLKTGDFEKQEMFRAFWMKYEEDLAGDIIAKALTATRQYNRRKGLPYGDRDVVSRPKAVEIMDKGVELLRQWVFS